MTLTDTPSPSSSLSRGDHRTPGGFTLIEVMIVVLLLGILSTFVLPSLQAGVTESRLSGAATEIIAAIEFAQLTAMGSGVRTRVTVNPSDDSILVEKFQTAADLLGVETSLSEGEVEGGAYSTMAHPARKGSDYLISFGSEERFSGVDITSSVFGGDDFVVFDALGAPSNGGTVTLSAGSRTLSVSLDSVNGKVVSGG
jgi:prepilin-type N-terminal cleavage/methylation domain-containing protein